MATAHLLSNAPPDAFLAFRLHIDDLMEQAGQFLDGGGVQNDAQAEDVSRILNMLRKASKDADEARKAEKRPHDEAAREVQAKWQPILGNADLAIATAKNALAPFLLRKEEEQRAVAEAAAQEAIEKAAAARLAAQQAAPDDLAGQTTVRVLQEQAADAQKAARRADKARPLAKGGERAVGLRSVWTAVLSDPVAFGKWAWEYRREEYTEFLQVIADREARTGPKTIPGLEFTETRKAV